MKKSLSVITKKFNQATQQLGQTKNMNMTLKQQQEKLIKQVKER